MLAFGLDFERIFVSQIEKLDKRGYGSLLDIDIIEIYVIEFYEIHFKGIMKK